MARRARFQTKEERRKRPGRRDLKSLQETAFRTDPLRVRRGPRMKGRPSVRPPGLKNVELRLDPEFLAWKVEVGNMVGTVPEWLVYRWLTRRGLTRGRDFTYLAVVGGPRRAAGIQVDFVLHETIGLAVQGWYWHYRTVDQRVKNELDRAVAEGAGLQYVELLEDDIINRTDATMTLALAGQEMPGARAGVGHAA